MKKVLVLSVLGFLVLAISSISIIQFQKSTHIYSSKIQAKAEVQWDAKDVPLITALSPEDAYFVQGYVTAQKRFFQMELVRRKMSGRLSEIFGPQAVPADTQARRLNYSSISKKAVEQMVPQKRNLLSAYADGVNSYLKGKIPSWEIQLLGISPEPWHPEDTILVVLSMYESLNRFEGTHERAMELLRKKLKAQTVSFLTPDWGFLDSPILEDQTVLPTFNVPSAEEIRVEQRSLEPLVQPQETEPGSNAWAISGRLTLSGLPLLASDPHLDLRVPNIWFRLGISTPNMNVYGVTIPGVPGIVIGRNTKVAWAFTNSAIDNADQVLVPRDSILAKRTEIIRVKNEPDQQIQFIDSPWGPIVEEKSGTSIALQWTALDPANLANLSLLELNEAQTTQDLLAAFGSWAGPPQNAIFATVSGDIGWTIAGVLPNREGFDGQSRSTRSLHTDWKGYVPRNRFPILLNPENGFIVSANQRSVPVTGSWSQFGHHWPNPARAKRILNLLASQREPWTPKDCLRVQTDVLSLTHLWYKDQLLSCSLKIDNSDEKIWLEPALAIISQWSGKADPLSNAYPILKYFREELFLELITPISQAISPKEKETIFLRLRSDGLVQNLLQTRPKHLLPKNYSSYCDLMKKALLTTVKGLVSKPEHLFQLKWGDFNQSKIQHPFSRKLPRFFARFLNLPVRPMPGDSLVPNVMTPTNGVSMRLVMDLSNNKLSLFSHPGGQSSNPFSKNYSDSFQNWLEGTPAPFEAETPLRKTIFTPAPKNG